MLTEAEKRERGQAIVFLALTMVVLIGFAAVALDGGQIWTEQRQAQSAADNAVLAAAYRAMKGEMSSSVLSSAALTNAVSNGYDNNRVDNWVSFHRPPISGPYVGNDKYFQIFITRTVPTVLAHFLYRGPWQVTVQAVAHGDTVNPLMDGYAIATLKPDCSGQSAISVQGRGGGSGGGTIIRGGGAFVNSSCPDALNMSGGDTFMIEDASFPINVVGGINPACPPNTNYDPCPNTSQPPVTQDPIQSTTAAQPPPCGPARNLNDEVNYTADGANTIRPGTYQEINLSSGQSITMLPGIYCINGTSANNAKFTPGNNGSIRGWGVLLYLATLQANIDVAGQGTLDISAANIFDTDCTTSPVPAICNYLGIIIYKTQGYNTCSQNDVEIKFSGQGEMYVRGLIYAPKSLAQYGGSGTLVMTGQSLVGCVKFNGNGLIDITYDPDSTYVPPPAVALDK